MSEPTVAAGVVLGLLEFAVSKGADRADLVERSQIDPAELQDRDGRIPFSKYVTLMRAGKELCDDPALALHFGEEIDMADLSVVGLIAGEVDTVADGVAMTNRFARLIVEVDEGESGDRFVLRRDAGRQLWLVDTRKNPNEFPELTESGFARMVCAARSRCGGAQFLKAVRVESLLLPVLHTGGASMDRIAAKLGVSRQTLFRRLRREGVTFREVLDDLRRRMALHYLTAERLTVSETSYRLGFSEPSAFSRAFQRWTGTSPKGAAGAGGPVGRARPPRRLRG